MDSGPNEPTSARPKKRRGKDAAPPPDDALAAVLLLRKVLSDLDVRTEFGGRESEADARSRRKILEAD